MEAGDADYVGDIYAYMYVSNFSITTDSLCLCNALEVGVRLPIICTTSPARDILASREHGSGLKLSKSMS